jgi:hypothetical protein
LSSEDGFLGILKTDYWDLSLESSVIRFSDDHYALGHPFHDGYFCRGEYNVSGNTVRIYYPKDLAGNILSYQNNVLEYVFEGKEFVEYSYDSDYIDFSVSSCLRHNEKILRNYAWRSPFGEKYSLNGIDVIKYNEMTDAILVSENLRMRAYPDIAARTVTLTRYLHGPEQEITGNILYEGSINNFNAITVKRDTIDGITAPWYHVSVDLGGEFSEYVWVFGGYLREIPQHEMVDPNIVANYYSAYYKKLVEKKLIRPY